MSPPTVSVVMPAHNEEASLRRVVGEIEAALREWTYEIVVVDDGSLDGTWNEIRSLTADETRVRGIRLTRNFGHQAALVAGLKAASGSAVIMMDADGQHPPALLPRFIRLWEAGHPIVQGVRRSSDGESGLKRLTSRVFYRLWAMLAGVPIMSGAADFRLLDRGVLDVLLAHGGSLTFLRGLIPWLGFDVCSVPFEAKARIAGRSAYTWRRMFRLSLDGLMAFSIVPLRLAMALGLLMSCLSFAYLCYVAVIWLYSSRVVPGWASTAGLVALAAGIQLFAIGVLGEYVGRIFLRTTDRPQFVVAERTTAVASEQRPALDRSVNSRTVRNA